MDKFCKSRFFIILLMWSLIQAETPDRTTIEIFLNSSASELISKETNLTKKINFFYSLVSICSSNLKASNVSSNLTKILDNYAIAINETRSINNHKLTQLNLTNLSSYDYAQFRISILFTEVQKFRFIGENLSENSMKFYQMSRNLLSQYLRSYKTISKITSKNKLINTVFRHFFVYLNEVSSYSKLLNIHSGNYLKLNTYLCNLIRKKTIPMPSNVTLDPFMEKLRAIENKLVPFQQNMISLAMVAIRKVDEALKTVQASTTYYYSSTRSYSSTKTAFVSVKKDLKDISKTSDYSLLGFPLLPDSNDDESIINIKIDRSSSKSKSYKIIQNNLSNNRSKLKEKREYINSATLGAQSSKKKVQIQTPVIAEALKAIFNVEKLQTLYWDKLENATKLIEILKVEMLAGRTTTGTTTTEVLMASTTTTEVQMTTTTTTTTTTTEMQTTTEFVPGNCGTFYWYDPVADPTLPARIAFPAGPYINGSMSYVGLGSTSYLNMVDCPARLMTNTLSGAFLATENSELRDVNQAYFLPSHPALMWSKVTEFTAFANSRALTTVMTDFTVGFGRINISGVTHVGRVHMGDLISGMFYFDPALNSVVKVPSTTEFEILGCDDIITSGCATFRNYKNATYLYSKALVAGRYYDGSIAYVATAIITDCHYSADEVVRVSTKENVITAYHACGNSTNGREVVFTGNLTIFRNYEGYAWKTTNMYEVANVTGIYTYWSGSSTMAAGRLKISNYTIVGKIILEHPTDNGFHYWNPETQNYVILTGTSPFEVLTCT